MKGTVSSKSNSVNFDYTPLDGTRCGQRGHPPSVDSRCGLLWPRFAPAGEVPADRGVQMGMMGAG
jgi:hypothetical protein